MSREEREAIDRYVAGKLDELERNEVDARIVRDPQFRAEVELVADFRAGLRDLESRGEIEPLLRPSSGTWQRPRFALAASVVAGLLALTSFALYLKLEHERAVVAGLLLDRDAARPTVAATRKVLTFALSRGAGPDDVEWSTKDGPATLELRFDPGAQPSPPYRVVVSRVDGAGPTALLEVPDLDVDTAGEIVLSVHSALLSTGEYEIRLTTTSGDEAQTVVYRLRVMP